MLMKETAKSFWDENICIDAVCSGSSQQERFLGATLPQETRAMEEEPPGAHGDVSLC